MTMTRRYCDLCTKEILGDDGTDRLRLRFGKVLVEVMTGFEGTWNAGDFHHDCVRKAVAEGKPLIGMKPRLGETKAHQAEDAD